jgi:hypothetical protein
MGFTSAEAAKPKEPRKDGQACSGGCGRFTSSCWRGPGSEWCNENCKDKAAAARAALTGDKKSAQLDALTERVDQIEADDDATYRATAKLAMEQKKMAAELRAAHERITEQAEDLDALRQQLARLAQAQALAPAPAVPAAPPELLRRFEAHKGIITELMAWKQEHDKLHRVHAEKAAERRAHKRPREHEAAASEAAK